MQSLERKYRCGWDCFATPGRYGLGIEMRGVCSWICVGLRIGPLYISYGWQYEFGVTEAST